AGEVWEAGSGPIVICEVATNSYCSNYGTGPEIGEDPFDGDGMFYCSSKISSKDVPDGTSQTLAIGERAGLFAQAPWPGAISGGAIRTRGGVPSGGGDDT